jgi:predicted NBD/HSP70 family sugar kinase
MHFGSVSSLHHMNKRTVFSLISKHKLITKPELSQLTGLKPPTINNIIAHLMEDGLVVHCGKGKSSHYGGPCPNQYCLNKDSRYFIGLDIGIHTITGVVVNIGSEILASDCIQCTIVSQDQLTQNILRMIGRVLKLSGIGLDRVDRIGVSMAALVDHDKGMILSSYSQPLNNYRFQESLYPNIRIPIYADNDINIIASGERLQVDKMKELNNVVCIGIREGIGVGIIINGQIYRGQNGLSCNLEGFSNAENYVTMIGRIQNALGEKKTYDSLFQPDAKTMSTKDLLRAVRDYPQIADIASESFVNIGQLAGMLVQLLSPEGLIVAGEIFNYNPAFFKTLVDSCKRSVFTVPAPNTEYFEVPLVENTIAYCAAMCVIDAFFNRDTALD